VWVRDPHHTGPRTKELAVCEASGVELVWRIAALTDAVSVRELAGGHQSRVFVAERPGGRLVAKVRNAVDVDLAAVTARAEAVARLAAIDPWVCGPVALGDDLVTAFEADGGEYVLTCCDFVDGRAPDPTTPADAALMGRVLARLHATMATVDAAELPLVAALLTVQPDWDGPSQLLHGDFNAGNLRVVDGWCRIFDFDDSGRGPAAFDVANTLLMVQFDDATGGRPGTYEPFEEAFLAGYRAAADTPIDLDDVLALVDLRVDALERWLDQPDTAPIGIRTSSPEWHETLRAFIAHHRG
jgi:Ser/Thr protein kinase RdoA (MazF antagonist)